MTEQEAYGCISILSEAYSNDKWSQERARIWKKFLCELDDFECAVRAIEELLRTHKYVPAISEVRDGYISDSRRRQPLALVEPSPSPEQVKAQASKIRQLLKTAGLR